MKTAYQLWGIAPARADWETLLARAAALQERRPAQALICGLDAPGAVYARIRALARAHDSSVYLWLPLFSEMDGVADFDPLIDFRGEAFLAGRTAGGFRFRCPGSEGNVRAMLAAYDALLEREAFDGVFLDRIRYPSFQYGLSGALSCFCPACLARYAAAGLDAQSLRGAAGAVARAAREGAENALGLRAFDGRRWRVADGALAALLDARCDTVTRAAAAVCAHLRARGLSVGLDLFTPSLSYFAGQDFAALAALADFVKPMLYLRTDAPAGLPYELNAMDAALGARGTLLRLLDARTPEALAADEVRRMARVKREAGFCADILCGVEYNRVPAVAHATPQTLGRDVRALRDAGAEGVTGCWNILYAPPENLDAFLDAIE